MRMLTVSMSSQRLCFVFYSCRGRDDVCMPGHRRFPVQRINAYLHLVLMARKADRSLGHWDQDPSWPARKIARQQHAQQCCTVSSAANTYPTSSYSASSDYQHSQYHYHCLAADCCCHHSAECSCYSKQCYSSSMKHHSELSLFVAGLLFAVQELRSGHLMHRRRHLLRHLLHLVHSPSMRNVSSSQSCQQTILTSEHSLF